MVRMLGAGGSPMHRIRTGVEFAVSGRHDVDDMLAQHASLARQLAERLDLPTEVGEALACSYERWDGKGWPGKVAGDAAPVASRIVQLAEYVEVAYRTGGTSRRRGRSRERRSGSQFDPTLVRDAVRPRRRDLRRVGRCRDLADGDRRRAGAHGGAVGVRRGSGAAGVAEFVDLKSPYMLGHSVAVAELAAAAGRHLNLSDDEIRQVAPSRARARVRPAWASPTRSGTSPARSAPASGSACASTRITASGCCSSPTRWRRWRRIVVQQRERLDGSGYPRGLPGNAISPLARILGAADAYQAMREERPHRPAHTATEAAAATAILGPGRAPRGRCRRRRARRRRPPRPSPPGRSSGSHRSRGRGPQASRPGICRTSRSPIAS